MEKREPKKKEKVLEKIIGVPDFEKMTDAEVIEFVLSFLFPKKNIKVMAQELIEKYDSFYGVLCATPKELCEVGEMTEVNAHIISNLLAVIRRAEISQIDRNAKILFVSDAVKQLSPYFLARNHERVYMLSIDENNRLLQINCLAKGSANLSSVDMSAMTSITARLNARKIILAHNHPGGNLMASESDVKVTSSVMMLLGSLGATLIDHIIFAGDSYYSFYEKGLLVKILEKKDKIFGTSQSKEVAARTNVNRYVLEKDSALPEQENNDKGI